MLDLERYKLRFRELIDIRDAVVLEGIVLGIEAEKYDYRLDKVGFYLWRDGTIG